MKIIHTSDWHLGQNLYSYDRTQEQSLALQQIEDLVRQETPDALVVSGDIYDTAQPSSAVQTLFTGAVMRMHLASPRTAIIITAGNHDSGSKHEISRVLWETQNVHMIGTINKEDTLEQIIELPGTGFIIAVPYSSERHIPEGFWQGLLDEVESRNEAGLPVVLSAHLTVSGCDFQGHENARDFSVGGTAWQASIAGSKVSVNGDLLLNGQGETLVGIHDFTVLVIGLPDRAVVAPFPGSVCGDGFLPAVRIGDVVVVRFAAFPEIPVLHRQRPAWKSRRLRASRLNTRPKHCCQPRKPAVLKCARAASRRSR